MFQIIFYRQVVVHSKLFIIHNVLLPSSCEKSVYNKHFWGLEILLLQLFCAILSKKFMSFFVVFMKTPVARSISTGSGMNTTTKEQTMDMNGPLVPEKVLKSIQVCVIYLARDSMLQCFCSVIDHRRHQNVVKKKSGDRK